MIRGGPMPVAGLLAVLVGCTPPPEAVGTVERVVVATMAEGIVGIDVPGRITNRQPVPIVPPVPWLVLARVPDQGSSVDEGDPLLEYDRADVERRLQDVEQEIAGREGEDARAELDEAATMERQRTQMDDLLRKVVVLEARHAGRSRDEPRDRRIARLATSIAERSVARARRRIEDTRTLLAAGRITPSDVAAAEADVTQAEAALVAARRDEASWEDGEQALESLALAIDLEAIRQRLDGGALPLADEQRSALKRREWRQERNRLDRRKSEVRRAVLAPLAMDPVQRSPVAGVVDHSQRGLLVGDKRSTTPVVFVLEDRETVAQLLVPPSWRDLAALDGAVELTTPVDPAAVVRGRIIGIGAAPIASPLGDGFPVTVRLEGEAPPPGVSVRARIAVPVQGAARLPRWALRTAGDPREPEAVRQDGRRHRVRALPVGEDLVVTEGLVPGDAVVALSDAGLEGADRRLTGTVEAEGALIVRLRTTDWDIIEVVPDGVRVSRGATLARLAKSSWWSDPDTIRVDQEIGHRRARLDRLLADADADTALVESRTRLVEARTDLRRAMLEQRRRDLALLGDRLTQAESAAARAGAEALRAAAAGEAGADPRVAPSLSLNAQETLALTASRAASRAANARLQAAAARIPDQLEAASAAIATAKAELEVASAARWSAVVRLDVANRRDRAARQYVREMERLERDIDKIIDEHVVAPVAGRVIHRPGVVLEPGGPIGGNEPFAVLPDPLPGTVIHRRLVLYPPAHRANEFQVGQSLPVTIPGAGTWPAEVITTGTWYGPRPGGRADEQVVDLVLRLSIPAEDADRVLPGMQGFLP